MTMKDKIKEYSIDEKTYKSLQIQFHHEYVYNMVLAKLLAELENKQYLCSKLINK